MTCGRIRTWSEGFVALITTGMEGERPARLNRGEADRDAYRRSAAPRKYTC